MILEAISQSRNRYIYFVFAFVLLFLIRSSYYYLPLLLIYGIFLYRNHKDLLWIIALLLLVYISRVFFFHMLTIPVQDQYEITVINKIKNEEYTSFLGKTKAQYIMVYFDENIRVEPGEVYLVSGILESPLKNTIPFGFSYKDYLQASNIKYTIFSDEYIYQSSSFSLYRLPYELEDYITKKCPLSKGYIKTFMLADQSDIDEEIRSKIKNIGISHLFAVSGLHIALIVLALQKMLSFCRISPNKREFIIIGILLVYLILTAFAPSITRASLMYLLLVLNKRYDVKLSSLDILSIVFFILILQKPFYYDNVGFVLSFLVTFAIITGHQLLQHSSKLKQLFSLSLLSFFITFPLIINLNYQINFLSLFYNVAFLLFVSYLILPFGYLTALFPFLDKLYFIFIKTFETLVLFFERQDSFLLSLSFQNPVLIMAYYTVLWMILIRMEQKRAVLKTVIALLLVVLLAYGIPFLKPTQTVSFIDVEGDAILITDRFNQCNILIDTGEEDDYNGVVNYIKSQGIKRLDYVFISHFHSDHFGELNDILNAFKVKNLVTNQNAGLYDKTVTHCGNVDYYLYDMSYGDTNENENSLMLSVFMADRHFLFTGDSEGKREVEFISNYQVKVDYLKVAHHGSDTSSSIIFIEGVSPTCAVISVDRNNSFGHPSSEIIERYDEYDIPLSRTDLDGTIVLKYIFGKEHKKVHRPS